MRYAQGRRVGFLVVMAFSVVSRVVVEANAVPLGNEAWWVTTVCTIAAWAALMGAVCRRRPAQRSDSALAWVGAMGFAVQASTARPEVILLPVTGLVLAIALATFILVRAPDGRARKPPESRGDVRC